MASSALAAGAPLLRQLRDEVLNCDGVLPIMLINLLKDMIDHLQGAPFRAEDGTAGARLGQCGEAPVAAAAAMEPEPDFGGALHRRVQAHLGQLLSCCRDSCVCVLCVDAFVFCMCVC